MTPSLEMVGRMSPNYILARWKTGALTTKLLLNVELTGIVVSAVVPMDLTLPKSNVLHALEGE